MVKLDSPDVARHVGPVNRIRLFASRLALILGWGCAAVFVIAIVAVVLNLTREHPALGWSIRLADVIDLGVFELRGGVFDFKGDSRRELNALSNWGLGAIAYVVVGAAVARLLRP